MFQLPALTLGAVNPGSTWGQPEVKLRSTWGQLRVNFGSTSGQLGVNLGSTLGQPGVNLGSTWGQSGVNLHRLTWGDQDVADGQLALERGPRVGQALLSDARFVT